VPEPLRAYPLQPKRGVRVQVLLAAQAAEQPTPAASQPPDLPAELR